MKETFQITIQIDRDKLSKNEVMELLKLRYPESKSIKRVKDYLTIKEKKTIL